MTKDEDPRPVVEGDRAPELTEAGIERYVVTGPPRERWRA